MFIENLKNTLNEEFNTSVTENGAIGYRTTGKELLDLNFSVTSMRSMSENDICEKFARAFCEDKLLAVKWLFYARDAREGVGERRLFRVCMKYLTEVDPVIVRQIIPLVPEYGRWDDLWCLMDTSLMVEVVKLVCTQLSYDLAAFTNNEPISLLCKWMPSINTSSEETRRLAKIFIKVLGFKSEKHYRKTLAMLRSYANVVETKTSRNKWHEIDYSAVPSRANLLYSDAFMNHDEERRKAYLDSLQKGETKINAGVLFPHDIVHKYSDGHYGFYSRTKVKPLDTTLEELWKALPDYVNGAGNTICVADGSGSMITCVGDTQVTALEVANALAIYFAERSSGQFKNHYITFSNKPQLVNLGFRNSLRDKLHIASLYNEVANTNIEAVFNLILTTAVENHMKQEDLPKNILILSDMEFDRCAYCGTGGERPNQKLFKVLAERYAEHGYKLPRLVFWNICGRTGAIPVKENDLGVALVSGFSPAIVNMVLSNSTDPYECLLEQLNSERYAAVEEALTDIQ